VVYLDYNATTPLEARALEAMLPYLREHHGNPSSIHAAGRQSRAAIDESRDRLAALLGARPHELIFTGGGTEANNLAILGLARSRREQGRHLVTSSIEHHAVLHAFEWLEKHEGFAVTRLGVDSCGRIDPEELREVLRPDTTLVSVMSANNETGTRQDIPALAALTREHGALFHTDAVQSFGKEPCQPGDWGVSALSAAAHKFYGPKGAGFLWLQAGHSIHPLLLGGAQENQRRPGTEDVASIVGMARAAEIAWAESLPEHPRLLVLKEQLWEGIRKMYPPVILNGAPDFCLANTLNISFPGVDGESLLISLDLEGVCASSGSACMVGSVQASHVLLAMGISAELASSTVRLSLGKFTTPKDIQDAIAAFQRVLRRLAPAQVSD
jgi:cysteine desulfurase